MMDKYLTKEEFLKKYADYLKRHHKCDDFEIKILVSEIADPYSVYQVPYYECKYINDEMIDGKNYTVEECYFDLSMFPSFNSKYQFKHKIYYQLDEGSHTVSDYVNADKLYEVLED